MMPARPVPTKLPSKLPVRLELPVEFCPVPLVMTRRSEVEPKKEFSENGTPAAASCHDPPEFDPAAGSVRAACSPSVRALKFTLTDAPPRVPAVLSWLVGDVAAIK